ncbi:hypothetical protein MHK_010559 [Candidatus Magnetomorum sp. HK-1]|nr:hypothetical protein MHK_010559 [Candidatus Magnetomorum sp. HK-1]
MQSLQQVVKVNNQTVIDLPPGFGANKLEVVSRPPTYNQDILISQLEKEIDIGLCSKVSIRSHKEIFDSLKEKYANI